MEFYILQNNKKQGPYSLEELSNKNINADTMVWNVGLSNWKPAKTVSELSDLLSNLPPVPPPSQSMPKTWLVESILVTCFCCLPFGIVGIINATKIETLIQVEHTHKHYIILNKLKNGLCGDSLQQWHYFLFIFLYLYFQ